MSTASQIGSVFGSLGSGVATVGGPVGTGIGAGFSVLGSIIGLGGKIKDRKREEEEKRKQLEEAQRKAIGDQGQQEAEAQSQQTTRTKQGQLQGGQAEQRSTQPGGFIQDALAPQQEPQKEQIMGPELSDVFAGLRPGGGGFFSG